MVLRGVWQPFAAIWGVTTDKLLAVALLMLVLMLSSRVVLAGEVISLNEPEVVSPAAVSYYMDETGDLRVNAVTNLPEEALQPLDYGRYFSLRKDNALWLRFKLHYPRRNALIEELEPSSWYVEVPNSLLDRVYLYEQKADGRFFPTQIAGDLVASEFWTSPEKHPLFKLRLQPGETHTIYVRLNNTTRTTVNLSIVNQMKVLPRQRLSSLIYGSISGALLLAALYSLVVAGFLRDRGFLLFSIYSFISLGMNLAYSGVLAQYVFSGLPHVVDASHGTLAMLGWGVSLFLVRRLCIEISPAWSRAMRWAAIFWVISAGLFFFVPRFPYGTVMIALLVPAAPVLSMCTAWSSYRNGDAIAVWVLSSYAVFSLLILLIVGVIFGLLPRFVPLETMVLFCQSAVILPLLVVLHARTTQQQIIALRAQAMPKKDVLTGLLKESLLQKKINNMRQQRLSVRIKTAVVILHVANLNRIALAHDSYTAEQSMLRTVIKIKRVLGDITNAARVGHARIGFIVRETDREEIRALAQELIALGQHPSRPEATPLQFQFAIAFLDPVDTERDTHILEKLHEVLDHQSSRTRRPVRFLDEYEQEVQGLHRHVTVAAADTGTGRSIYSKSTPRYTHSSSDALPAPSGFSKGFGPVQHSSQNTEQHTESRLSDGNTTS